ncbi:uncharacterized protein LOC112688289 [Sipha flava]|uniref:Gustatory receptor n=2 Tax=Sipha flava TaxID=143950 RepID=A0A8B8G2I6_9HEMI|nr:uncharacterized protein LOC112688289 [Sipha flava]
MGEKIIDGGQRRPFGCPSTWSTLKCLGQTVILVSCVFNYVMTPHFECVLEGGYGTTMAVNPMAWVYSRSVSVACFMAYAVMSVKYRGGVAEYRARIALHDAYSPTTDAERRAFATFNAAVASACALLILPVNGMRLFRFVEDRRPIEVIVYFGLIYSQNALTCLMETRFVLLCYVLYTKFVRINRDMETIGDQLAADRGCPSVRRSRLVAAPVRRRHANRRGHYWVRDDGDMYRLRATGQRLVDAIERLKIRHRLMREAVDELQYVFAVPVGFSLCNLCVMGLFDIYYQLLNMYIQQRSNRSSAYIYLWLMQYMLRFFIIVITVHAATNQALRSKYLITHVSRNCLDVSTKEELQIFSNQISSTTMEFTICDLFTLNTKLFASAMAASITYLIILLQMKTEANDIY